MSDKNIKPVIKYHNNYIRKLLYRKQNKLIYQIYKLNIIDILKNKNQFILKKHYIKRKLACYIYYHRQFCYTKPKAISLFYIISKIKKITISDQISIYKI